MKVIHLGPPNCWNDGSCDSPIKCYLHGCRQTGYTQPETTEQQRQQLIDQKLAHLRDL